MKVKKTRKDTRILGFYQGAGTAEINGGANCPGNGPQRPEKETGETGDQKMNREHPDHIRDKISLNTEKSPGKETGETGDQRKNLEYLEEFWKAETCCHSNIREITTK